MKISIITPSFNQGKYIRDCIESVRTQTYRPIEHIIFDNCSTDSTKSILEEYTKNPNGIDVKIHIEPDNGQSEALNKGFRMAKGEIIGWLNADDYYLDNFMEKIVEQFRVDSATDILYGNIFFVDEKGRILRERKEIEFDYRIVFYYGCYVPTTSTFFRRTIFDNKILLNTSFHYLMDTEFFLRLHKEGFTFKHVPEFIACFRWHQGNKSHSVAARLGERVALQQLYGPKLMNRLGIRETFYKIMATIYFMKRALIKLFKRCYF